MLFFNYNSVSVSYLFELITPMKEPLVLVQTSVNQLRQAERIANLLVEEKLCACVHIAPVTSVYRWQARITKEQEYLLSAKTIQKRCAELKTRLSQLHPYELPEIIVLAIKDSDARYVDWVVQQCS